MRVLPSLKPLWWALVFFAAGVPLALRTPSPGRFSGEAEVFFAWVAAAVGLAFALRTHRMGALRLLPLAAVGGLLVTAGPVAFLGIFPPRPGQYRSHEAIPGREVLVIEPGVGRMVLPGGAEPGYYALAGDWDGWFGAFWHPQPVLAPPPQSR